MADWLGYGLEETLSDTPETGVVRKVRANAGLVRYEPRSDTPDWPQALKDLLANEKPSAIIVMLGLNDRQALREPARAPAARTPPNTANPDPNHAGQPGQPGQPAQGAPPPPATGERAQPAAAEPHRTAPGALHEFRTEKWAELYAKRIDDMIAALKAKNVPVLWVGLPAIRGPRSTSDMGYLNDLYRTRAEKAGIVYVDVWDGFVDEAGRYAVQGPDFEGQTRRLRTGDGVHFTKAGAIKLAHYAQRELRRALAKTAVPVALPTSEEPIPAPARPGDGPAPRPVAGPVVPLGGMTGGGQDGELLGGGAVAARPAKLPVPDATVSRVLTRGESIAAPTGRADDFAWPRRGFNANGEPLGEPEPVALTPPPEKAKPTAARPGDRKKTDAKAQPAPEAQPVRPRRAPRAELDGAPRPPSPR
jgi:hypothetical protein